MEAILPAPRVKDPLWKMTLWLVVLFISAQVVWLGSIPFFRHTVKVETRLAVDSVNRKKNIEARIRDLETKPGAEPVPPPAPVAPALPRVALDSIPETPVLPAQAGGAPELRPLPSLRAETAKLSTPPAPATPELPAAQSSMGDLPAPSTRLSLGKVVDIPAEVEKLSKEAREFRAMGDFALARVKLKEALGLQPDNPQTLSAWASLHEAQGGKEEARKTWEKIMLMGTRAGTAYELAKASIARYEDEEAAQARSNYSRKRASLPRLLFFAPVKVETLANGSRQAQIEIKSSLRVSAISARDLRLQILFFDADDNQIHNNRSVGAEWQTHPLNWSNGDSETIQVRVGAPEGTGRRPYGYILRVLQRDELQDEIADPPHLADDFPSATPEPTPTPN